MKGVLFYGVKTEFHYDENGNIKGDTRDKINTCGQSAGGKIAAAAGDSSGFVQMPFIFLRKAERGEGWDVILRDPMGRDVEESEWERYLELGLTGYVKYGYHQIVDYMPDELMLVSGAGNPLVLAGTMAEAQLNGRWNELDYLLIKNNRSYSHGFTEGFWDFTLGNLEGLVTKPLNDWDRMSSYVGDVFSGRNTDNWLMTGAKLVSIPLQCVSGIPLYDSFDRMDEDMEKAKTVAAAVWQIAQMNPAEQAELVWLGGRAIYNHYNEVFHSEEGVAQLFYDGGYGAGAVTGIAADAVVGNAVAKELMQIGGELRGIVKGGSEIRNRQGKPVIPIEKTLDMALDPETYANTVAEKYGINLSGSGQGITIRYNPDLRPGTYGRTTAANPNVIEIGLDALMSENELANTIAHELNHARDFLKGGQALEAPAYNSGNALSDYINGGR